VLAQVADAVSQVSSAVLGQGAPLATGVSALEGTLDAAAAAAPGLLAPVVASLAEDVRNVLSLNLAPLTVLRLSAFYYLFLTRPAPFWSLLDYYVLTPGAALTQKRWAPAMFALRDRLGGGNYGVTYEAIKVTGPDEEVASRLTADQKNRRLVLKRVGEKLGSQSARSDFLSSGTIARGVAESGLVEGYMCRKLSRVPAARGKVAEFLGDFVVKQTEGAFSKGTQWLVWKFESDSTLGDALDGTLGPFPGCLTDIMVRRVPGTWDQEKRDHETIKVVLRQIFVALRSIHGSGIVHRDIKPENIIVTVEGKVLLIDFGAATDLSTGINFNPQYGMLDPRYSPPEQLVMPEKTPKSPPPAIASFGGPLLWAYGAPDLFDTFSAGVVMLQMCVPTLHTKQAQKNFIADLAKCDYDVQAWRDSGLPTSRGANFALLDRAGGAGWDLVTKLLAKRNSSNRGRLSASGALGHRYFRSA